MTIYKRNKNKDKEDIKRELEEPLLLLTNIIKALIIL